MDYVGKIIKNGVVVGRIDLGDDGKAMVFTGADGEKRVQLGGADARYSDDDAPAMVDALMESLDLDFEDETVGGAGAGNSDLEQYIKVSADSVQSLRKPDVYRVIELCKPESRNRLAEYIKQNRNDLASEVDDVMIELSGEDAAATATDTGEKYPENYDWFNSKVREAMLNSKELSGDPLPLSKRQAIKQEVAFYGGALLEGGGVLRSWVIGADPVTKEGVGVAFIVIHGDPVIVVRAKDIQGVNMERAMSEALSEYKDYLKDHAVEGSTESLEAGKSALKALSPFLSTQQRKAVASMMTGEEGQFFIDKMIELKNRIDTMPKTYGQDGKGDKAVAYLHYFRGGMDWYITEKDMEGEGTEQAFGLADLGHGGELGYISIVELVLNGVELDFHFEPQTLAAIKGVPEKADGFNLDDIVDALAEAPGIFIRKQEADRVIFSAPGMKYDVMAAYSNGDTSIRAYFGWNGNGKAEFSTPQELAKAFSEGGYREPTEADVRGEQAAPIVEQKTEETAVEPDTKVGDPVTNEIPPVVTVDPEKQAAQSFFAGILDKSADFTSEDLATKLVHYTEKYENDPDMADMIQKATDIYVEFAMAL